MLLTIFISYCLVCVRLLLVLTESLHFVPMRFIAMQCTSIHSNHTLRHAPTLQDTTHVHTCFQLAFTSIHNNHTLRHAPHTTRYHDAQKCFQLAFTSFHSNHTLRHAPTLQDTTTHRNASSSRSRRFTVTIPCVMHPHYKIPRRTEMLPARVHVDSQ